MRQLDYAQSKISVITTRALARVAGGSLIAALVLVGNVGASSGTSRIDQADSLCRVGAIDSAQAIMSGIAEDSSSLSIVPDTSYRSKLYDIGATFESYGKLDAARRAYKIAARSFDGFDPPNGPTALIEASKRYHGAGAHLRSEVFGRVAVAALREGDNPLLVDALIQLGSCLISLFKFDEAKACYREAATLAREYYGDRHVKRLSTNWALCHIYQSEERYAEAEPLYRETLGLYIESLGENSVRVAGIRQGLGTVYQMLGRHDRAMQEYTTALTIFENGNPPRQMGVANSLQSMADLLWVQGHYDQAAAHLERAYSITAKEVGRTSSWTCDIRTRQAELNLEWGELSTAEAYQRETLHIVDSSFGSDHKRTIDATLLLGHIRFASGDVSHAESLYTQALSQYTATFGEASLDAAECFESLAQCARQRHDRQLAIDYATRALSRRRAMVREFSFGEAERDALLTARQLRHAVDLFLSTVQGFDLGSGALDSLIATVIITGKGEITDPIFQRRQLLAHPKDPVAEELWQSYRLAQHALSELFVEGPGDEDNATFRGILDSTAMVVNECEARLARHVDQFRVTRDESNITFQQLAATIPDSVYLVEYLRYDYLPVKQGRPPEPRYIVMVLDKSGIVAIRDLGPAASIDATVSRYRRHFAAIASQGTLPRKTEMSAFNDITSLLYRHLWKPIDEVLDHPKLVLIAPDGELNRIAFSTLKEDGASPYLIEDTQFHYLASGRDLIRLTGDRAVGVGLLALGDPTFQLANTASSQGRSATPNDSSQQRMAGTLKRIFQSRCQDLGDINLNSLPHTRDEIEEVISIWRSESLTKVDTLLGLGATEERFKQLAKGRRAIHLATHGYYLPSTCDHGGPPLVPASRRGPDIEQNPLLESGLFLAGCVARDEAADSTVEEDGVLTAAEIVAMDLSGTDLVVLSACETGMGQLQGGEGVYGLRRAFQVAGVQTVVSTLWSIADEFTAPMLPALYKNVNSPLPARLQKTQLDWLKRLRDRGVLDHPYTWGAFIAEGDWK